MNYITSSQAAEKWGISITRIYILAKDGRIPGAVRMGYQWMIPADTPKPADGRTRNMKALKAVASDKREEPSFRYPAYVGRDPSSVFPPLCEEEIQLKNALEAMHACRFEDVDKILADLPKRTTNRYHRIYALRLSCMVSIYRNDGKRFIDCYSKMTAEMQNDFPHKKEMLCLVQEQYSTLGENRYFSEKFSIEPGYAYHESFLPHLSVLSVISLFYSDYKDLTLKILELLELNCALLDQTENYLDIQLMHLYLGLLYAVLKRKNETDVHLQRALKLADEHEFYYSVCTEYYYMKEAFVPVLADFPEAFRERLELYADQIHTYYVRFMDTISMNSFFEFIRGNEFIYIQYAVQRMSNKEIAKLLNVSASTVNRKYSEIFDHLGVKNKTELISLYYDSIERNE